MAFGIDIDFNAQVGKLSNQVEKISQDLGRFEKKAQQVTSAINTSFAALGAGLSVAAFTSFVKNGIDAADALSKLSTRTGIAVEELTGLKLAAELSDISVDTLGKNINKLSINIAKNREEFAKLGITAKDPTEAFLQVADVFSSIEDAQERAAFGAKVFGKAYADLAPLLAQSSAAIREQVKQGKELSGLTQEQADKAAEFNDKLTVLDATSAGFRSRVALGILEPLAAIASEMDKNIEKFGVFNGLIIGFNEGVKNFAFEGNIGLSDELDRINLAIAEAKRVRDDIGKRQRLLFKDLGAEVDRKDTEKQNQIILDLERKRQAEIERIRSSRTAQTEEQKTGPTPEQISGFIGTQKEEAEAAKKQTEAERQRQEILREGIRLTEQMRTPVEKLAEEQAKYKSLLDSGAISISTYTRAMQAANDATLNLIGANEELSSAEQFRQKSEADSLKIRLEQQRLDIINQRVTPDNEKPFQNLQPQTPQIDEAGIKSQLEKAVNNPEQPLKMKIQIDTETLTKNLTSAVDLAQQQIQPIVIPVAYEIIDDGTGQSGNVAQQLNRQALARGRR